jgi:hypothetical protein
MGDAIRLKLQAVLDSRSTSCPHSWSAMTARLFSNAANEYTREQTDCFCGDAVTATPAALAI